MAINPIQSAMKSVSHFLIVMAITFTWVFTSTLLSFAFFMQAQAQDPDQAIIVVLDGEPLGVMAEVVYQIETGRVEVNLTETVWAECRQDRIFHDRFSHLEDNSLPLTIILNGEDVGTMRRFEYHLSDNQIWIFSQEGVACQAI